MTRKSARPGYYTPRKTISLRRERRERFIKDLKGAISGKIVLRVDGNLSTVG